MSPVETRPGQVCKKTEIVARRLRMNFMNRAARQHLMKCVACRNTLADKSHDSNISELARNIRTGMGISG